MFGFNTNKKYLLTTMTFPLLARRTMRLFFGSQRSCKTTTTYPVLADDTMDFSLAPKQLVATLLASKIFAGGFMCKPFTYTAHLFTARACPFFLDYN
jgi:hypothetical protein